MIVRSDTTRRTLRRDTPSVGARHAALRRVGVAGADQA